MEQSRFIFDRYQFEVSTGVLQLCYLIQENGQDELYFEERITFPLPSRPLSEQTMAALDRAFRLVFLLAGVSYYKAKIPSILTCNAFPLDQNAASFIETTYRHGLGEFAFRNNVTLDFSVQHNQAVFEDISDPKLGKGVLVPVGGGKDSIVTIETLKRAGKDVTLFALGGATGPAAPIAATIERSGLPVLNVQRILSPQLMELNQSGALNGHVPITAILSAIAVATAVLHEKKSVILSNEHSASAPNIKIGEHEVNHQYSKSLSFERNLSAYVRKRIATNLDYFSFLRPLTETAIAKRFTEETKYHDVFRSCNTAFRQDERLRSKNWCCNCPKCRFVFLALAPFMPKKKLLAIFGCNLLDDLSQTEGFKELCGLSSHKPFECVGEVQESALLLGALSRLNDWKKDYVVDQFGKDFDQAKQFEDLFTLRTDHNVPEDYFRLLV